jgi:hypothetical protein
MAHLHTMPIIDDDVPLTEAEAALVLGTSIATLRRWRWVGKGPRFMKIGACVRYDIHVLRAFKASSERRSTSDTSHRK